MQGLRVQNFRASGFRGLSGFRVSRPIALGCRVPTSLQENPQERGLGDRFL